MSLKSENEPINWYTFYSQKAGREYFFEPKSGVATWILPDDLHPQPVVKPREVPLGRHVSFHESVENPEMPAPRSLGKVGDTRTRNKLNDGRPISVIASIIKICLCVLLGTAFTGWLSRGMLGIEMYGNDADKTEVSTGAFLWNSNESDIQSIKAHEPSNVEHKGDTERQGETLFTTAEEKHAEDTAAAGQGSKEINETLVPTNCLLPFAHLFSRECRRVLAKRPVYDMDAFLDSMI
jgi:hypothetical protein